VSGQEPPPGAICCEISQLAHSCFPCAASMRLFLFSTINPITVSHFEAQMSNGVASPFDERLSSRVPDGATSSMQPLLTRPPRPREAMR
jgi:hypothetical protein